MGKPSRRQVILLIPFLVALILWLSPLAFVPVPWPDDSAFYHPARTLFSWPPRWVMLPQAPFEPTYKIFSFNIMPLFSIVLGLGRLIGIDGSHLLKLWPLVFYAGGAAYLAWMLLRQGLKPLWVLPAMLAYVLDPELRWASTLVRPESLIGLLGIVALDHALFRGESRRFKLWDPIAGCLAAAAYTHFNSVHLVLPVAVALLPNPRRLFRVGGLTLLYLSPWLITVLTHWGLFMHQMELQWGRLAVHNDWLDSIPRALASLFQSMGAPEPWPDKIVWVSGLLWLLMLVALGFLLGLPSWRVSKGVRLAPPDWAVLSGGAWVLSAMWLWHSKPEVWFVSYTHMALWVFMGLLTLWLSQLSKRAWLIGASSATAAAAGFFLLVDIGQWSRLGSDPSWTWSSYHQLVDCVDKRLTEIAERRPKGSPPPQFWCPTFPDITIELSRRHPDWELTRTNDFYTRNYLAIEHGKKVDAVAVTEIWGEKKRVFSGPSPQHPGVESVWMTWQEYFLNQLYRTPGWMPDRYVCNVHRWQAFVFTR